MVKTKNKDIVYGDIEVSEDDLRIENAKVRINTWVDGDILMELKKRAKEENTKYQTLLNKVLRESLFKEKVTLEDIARRLQKIEKIVI